MFRVWRRDSYPRKKREFYDAEFPTRQKARQFCRNRAYSEHWIVHPDGTEEKYEPTQDP